MYTTNTQQTVCYRLVCIMNSRYSYEKYGAFLLIEMQRLALFNVVVTFLWFYARVSLYCFIFTVCLCVFVGALLTEFYI